MIIANSVTYAAADSEQQNIPWVKVTHDDGSEEIFVADGRSLSAEELKSQYGLDNHGLKFLKRAYQSASFRMPFPIALL